MKLNKLDLNFIEHRIYELRDILWFDPLNQDANEELENIIKLLTWSLR